jgi:hypothetical protein
LFCHQRAVRAAAENSEDLKRVRELESKILESKTNANLLVQLLQELTPLPISSSKGGSKQQQQQSTVIFAAGLSLRRVFARYLADGELLLTKAAVSSAAADKSAIGTFRVWLNTNYISMSYHFISATSSSPSVIAPIVCWILMMYGWHRVSTRIVSSAS